MRVPTYDNFQVSANTLPGGKFGAPVAVAPQVQRGQLANAPQYSNEAARQLQETGNNMQRMGKAQMDMVIQMQEQDNNLRVDDALNKAKEETLRLTFDEKEGYSNLKGLSALDRPDKKALPDEYGERLQTRIDELAGTLGNDRQKQLFALKSREMSTNFKTSAMRHMVAENQTYQMSVSEGIQATEARSIGLNWNNPDAVVDSVKTIQAEVYRQAKLSGKSAEWTEAVSRKATSDAHKTALLAALEQNHAGYADQYLKRFAKDMDADDILSIRGHITKEIDASEAITAASETFSRFQPEIEPSAGEKAFNVQGVNFGKAFNILTGTESNNKQFDKDGKPLTSSAGAIGIAQVMPDTAPEAAKLAGLKWDENKYKNDPEYNKALGMAYFQKQLQTNGGDLAMAYAAYNAGPGRLKQGIKQAEKEGGNWLEHMPAETRAYVAKNMGEYEKGNGAPKRPTLEEIDASLKQNPRLANNPERLKLARAEVAKAYKNQTDAIKQREDETVNSALQGVIDNGGNFAGLPVSIRSAIPPDQVSKVMELAEKIGKGETVKTDPNIYYALTMQAAKDPRGFSGTDMRQFVDKLSPSDQKHFMDMQAKAADPGTTEDISTATQQKSAMIDLLGLKKDEKGMFLQEADKALYAAQLQKGKPLDQTERQKVLDTLVLQGNKGFWGGSEMLFEAKAENKAFKPAFTDVQRRGASDSFERIKGRKPTEKEVEAILLNHYGFSKPQGGATGSF